MKGIAKYSGFTLIELVIVIIILGLLAATALPRFINVTEQAEDVSIEGLAGGFASAVGLVRAQWEVEGRYNNNLAANRTAVNYSGVSVGVDGSIGYPSGNPASDTRVTAVDGVDCLYLVQNLFQGVPKASTTFDQSNLLYVRVDNNICVYHQNRGLAAAPTSNADSNGFTYNPTNGQVSTFLNKPN